MTKAVKREVKSDISMILYAILNFYWQPTFKFILRGTQLIIFWATSCNSCFYDNAFYLAGALIAGVCV